MLSAMYTSGQNQMFQRALLKHNRIGPVTFIGDENARLRSRPIFFERSAPCRNATVSDNPYH